MLTKSLNLSTVGKGKNLSSETTFVSIRPQMETKAATKKNANLKRKTKAQEEVKLSENVVRDEKEDQLKMEFADEKYSPKRHKHYKGETGLEIPLQTSTTSDMICFNQNTTDAVSHEGLDFEVARKNANYNKVTKDSSSIKKVKDCKHEISYESYNFTGSAGVTETSTLSGENKQELGLSRKGKQIKSSTIKNETDEDNTTNVNSAIQLSVDKNNITKGDQNSDKIIVSEDLRLSQSINNDLKTVGNNNKFCNALENNELRSASNIVAASLYQKGEEFAVKAISQAGDSDSC